MSLSIDEHFCAHCTVTHAEHSMDYCDTCKQWTCQSFTLDEFNEVCNECYPEFKEAQDIARAERQAEHDLSSPPESYESRHAKERVMKDGVR